jgi:hypothetical protein
MGTVIFNCGCYISRSMFGERKILKVGHCSTHYYLYSENKTIRQMANEIQEKQER